MRGFEVEDGVQRVMNVARRCEGGWLGCRPGLPVWKEASSPGMLLGWLVGWLVGVERC